MPKRPRNHDRPADPVEVGTRVRVHPGTDSEKSGVVVDDFGDISGHAVQIGGQQFVAPARRWAVSLDAGELVFVDDSDLIAE